jgi:hypothetical protein
MTRLLLILLLLLLTVPLLAQPPTQYTLRIYLAGATAPLSAPTVIPAASGDVQSSATDVHHHNESDSSGL